MASTSNKNISLKANLEIKKYHIEGKNRLTTIEEIITMKVEVVQREGRKKDFWDLHKVLDKYSIAKMLELNDLRYPYTHHKELVIKIFTDFRTRTVISIQFVCIENIGIS